MSKELRAIEDERHKIEDEASMDIFWMFAFLFVAVCVCWLLLNYCLDDSGRQGGRPKYDSLNYDTWDAASETIGRRLQKYQSREVCRRRESSQRTVAPAELGSLERAEVELGPDFS
jgi:hypothetical protein